MTKTHKSMLGAQQYIFYPKIGPNDDFRRVVFVCFFMTLLRRAAWALSGVRVAPQREGAGADLGARMLAAFESVLRPKGHRHRHRLPRP